jgi:hypothetical protein
MDSHRHPALGRLLLDLVDSSIFRFVAYRLLKQLYFDTVRVISTY